MLYAHSENVVGERQPLVEHLRNVGRLAGDLASPFGGDSLASLAGLWHDVGKADPEWQRLLAQCEKGERKRVGLDHKCAGALLAEEAGGAAWAVGLLIQAHHGGLQSLRGGFEPWLEQHRRFDGPRRAVNALRAEIQDLTYQSVPSIPDFVQSRRDADLFLRMTYSALVDADSLDTETHQLSGAPSMRGSVATLAELWSRYEKCQMKPALPESTVNRVRQEVHEACLQAASRPRGVFRLTVPTGGGKTRSAMVFALRHGMTHGLRRVVVAVPFTTITQQTARVYRDIFEEGYSDTAPVVLEHHMGATDGAGRASGDEDNFAPDAVWQRLAAENWDAPIVVTTTVQLFESLFSNRRSKTRKLHNLAGSVVILDEAQALPAGLLAPILDALRQLTLNYGASVVLSTATQPAFQLIPEFSEVTADEIVPDHARHFELLRRVEYEFRTDAPNAWSDVADWMRREHNALAVVNTKRHATELLDALDDVDALHLSTRLCGAHRRVVLEEVGRRLREGEACRLVSTQVVEAGVDLDFASVFRAEAPLDAIIQAAGRCNREGTRERGWVVVFKPPDDASPPGVYRTGRDIARVVRQYPGFDPNDPQAVHQYFRFLFGSSVDPDQHRIQRSRDQLDFSAVANKFRMIPEEACDVIVPYPESAVLDVERLLEQLRTRERPPREVLRRLQPHTVSLFRGEYDRLRKIGLVEEIDSIPGMGLWHGGYDHVRGIAEANPELII